MDRLGQSLLEELHDEDFCEVLVALLSKVDEDGRLEGNLAFLYEPWVLLRLKRIRQHAAHLYFGAFLAPLRATFPRLVFPPDLQEAMQSIESTTAAAQFLVSPATFLAAADLMQAAGLPRGVSTGWPTVDRHYTVLPGEFTVVTGVASHFKSTWVQALCVNLALHHDWKVGIFSPEHYPIGRLGHGLMACYAAMPTHQMDPTAYRLAVAWLTTHFYGLQQPDEVPPTLPLLLAAGQLQVEQYGIKGLVLDPWNEIDHQLGTRTETQYVSAALSQVRHFARSCHAHVWLVAHPTKMQKAQVGPYQGKYPPPTPYDISGSAHFYNKADNCLSVWRDVQEDSPDIEVHVQKVRNRGVGKPGLVSLTYTGTRFIEPPSDGRASWQV